LFLKLLVHRYILKWSHKVHLMDTALFDLLNPHHALEMHLLRTFRVIRSEGDFMSSLQVHPCGSN
jgi:hypothetical protein